MILRPALLLLTAALALAPASAASGAEGYVVPGVQTGQVLMSVHVWGEVTNPGTQMVPADCDLVAALSQAGGPTAKADIRHIRVIIDGVESEYDLDSFLSGSGGPVPVMSPGATVFVPVSHADWWKDALNVAYTVLVTANLVWIMLQR